MKHKGKLMLTALVVAVVAGFALVYAAYKGREEFRIQVFNGKKISVWVKEALATDQYYQFTETFRAVGAEATPFLVPALRKQDSRLNAAWVKLWPQLPGVIARRFDQPVLARDLRMRAVVLFREMGPPGKGAVPALIERLSDADGTIPLLSAIALGDIGPDAMSAVPSLTPLLTASSYNVRVYTAHRVVENHQATATFAGRFGKGFERSQRGLSLGDGEFSGQYGAGGAPRQFRCWRRRRRTRAKRWSRFASSPWRRSARRRCRF